MGWSIWQNYRLLQKRKMMRMDHKTLKATSGAVQSLINSLPVSVSPYTMPQEHLFWMIGIPANKCYCKNAALNSSTYLSVLSCKANIQLKMVCFGLLIRSQKYKYHRAFMCLRDVNQHCSASDPFIIIQACLEKHTMSHGCSCSIYSSLVCITWISSRFADQIKN